MNFEQILKKEIDNWQEIQDMLSNLTGLAILLVDNTGKPLSTLSSPQHFCQFIRNNHISSHYCEKCDLLGASQAVNNKENIIYSCPFKLIDMAFPIIVNNTFMGAIIAGQIRISEPQNYPQLFATPFIDVDENAGFLKTAKQLYNEIPIVNIKKFESAIKFLKLFSTDFFSKIIKHHMLTPQQSIPISLSRTTEHYKTDLLQPILIAIQENININYSINQLATMINVSNSYFRTIFKEVMNESFSSYYRKLKINHAKIKLQATNLSIYEISESIGYKNIGYFIKIFKNSTGLTPKKYRESLKYQN